jgi:plastocyanin
MHYRPKEYDMRAFRLAVLAALPFAFSIPIHAAAPEQIIAVWSFGFAPSPIRLAAGQEVTLAFQNRSGSSHDFSAKGFFDHARIIAGAAPGGEVDLAPHETKVITLVPGAGTFHAHCSHFMHEQLGMTVYIIVT